MAEIRLAKSKEGKGAPSQWGDLRSRNGRAERGLSGGSVLLESGSLKSSAFGQEGVLLEGGQPGEEMR
jgi:hypothetical protein